MTDDNNLESITGVGPAIAENLRAAGFESPEEVRNADVDELAEVELIGESTAAAILGQGGKTKGVSPIVDDHIDEIIEHAKKPISDRGVIRLSPIGRRTHKDWMKKDGEPYETYQERWDEARAKSEEKLAMDGLYGDADSSLVKFLLKATHGYEDKQTHEVDADIDQKISGDGFSVEFE